MAVKKELSFWRIIIGLAFFGMILWGLTRASSFILFAVSPHPESPTPGPQYVMIERGMSGASIAQKLGELGITQSSRRFLALGKFLQYWKSIKVGEYELSAEMTPLEIFSTLTSGISASRPTTIREGKNIFQIGESLELKGLSTKKDILRLCRDANFIESMGFTEPLPKSLEGYLFPDTYFFNRTQSAKEIIRKMHDGFLRVWTAGFEARASQLGLSRHEVITLASIIEKETGAPEERPIISSVFHNRLKKRMRLQSDPTTIYGIWETFNGNLRRKHLKQKNQYNTYAMGGLPIGPIANPGKEAIHAALYPKESPFLYFVSKNDGTHYFSRTFEEHNEAVRKYQLNRKARRGKSWRDRLKKKKASE